MDAETDSRAAVHCEHLFSARKGIEIFDSLPFPSAKAFECRDPFGNRA
jgi:hypothetical protein